MCRSFLASRLDFVSVVQMQILAKRLTEDIGSLEDMAMMSPFDVGQALEGIK